MEKIVVSDFVQRLFQIRFHAVWFRIASMPAHHSSAMFLGRDKLPAPQLQMHEYAQTGRRVHEHSLVRMRRNWRSAADAGVESPPGVAGCLVMALT